jgi:hypothetical protein
MNNYNKIASPDKNDILFSNEKKIPWWRKARSLSPPKDEEYFEHYIDNNKTSENFIMCGNYENKKIHNEKCESNSSDLTDDTNEGNDNDSENFKNKI